MGYCNEKYYYAPHRSQWGVWKRLPGPNSTYFGEFIKDFPTKEEAKKYVYEMNGWNYKG